MTGSDHPNPGLLENREKDRETGMSNGNNWLPSAEDCHPWIQQEIRTRQDRADNGDITQSSADKYCSHLRWYQKWLDEQDDVDEPEDVSKFHVRRLAQDLNSSANGQTPGSRFREIAKIHKSFGRFRDVEDVFGEFANADDMSDTLALSSSDEDGKDYAVTKKDVEQLIEAAHPDKMMQLIIRLIWQTGMRVGEVVSLRISDDDIGVDAIEDRDRAPFLPKDDPCLEDSDYNPVPVDLDRESREITIRGEISKGGDTSDRTVAYQPNLDPLLDEWLNRERKKCVGWQDSPYLFLTEQGNQIRTKTIRQGVVDAAWRVNELYDRDFQQIRYNDGSGRDRKRITPHNIRHGFGTHLATDTPVGIYEVSRLMGHSDVETTERVYISDGDRVGVDELKEHGPR